MKDKILTADDGSDHSACSFCLGKLRPRLEVELLRSLKRTLYQCESCGSCQFPNPDWLERAYSKAISELDTGIVQRSIDIANVLTPILLVSGYAQGNFLDFGGGLGLFSRLMRDRGFKFVSYDPISDSVFSIPSSDAIRLELVTLIEVLEHLANPFEVLQEITKSSSTIFLSTLCIPKSGIESNWWYLLPDTGQHILFPTASGLKSIASRLGMHLTTNNQNLHLLTKAKPPILARFLIRHQKLAWMLGHIVSPPMRKRSLGPSDQCAIAESIFS